MRPRRLATLALTACLAAGCGDILGELDHANEIASKPSGNRPPPAAGRAPDVSKPARPGALPQQADRAGQEAPTVLSRVQGLLGLGDDGTATRRPPDPNDPMVLCRLGGSNGFMLKSGCINRRGTVVANKGVPH